MKADNLRKTDGSEQLKNGEKETFSEALMERTNNKLTRNS